MSYLKESKKKVEISFSKFSNNEYGFEYPKYASNETLVIDPVPNRLWGTYYGGVDIDEIWSVDIDISGNIVLGGHTESNINIASSGAWDVDLNGTRDAFIARFYSSGSRNWGTYFGGIGNEYLFNLVIDNASNIFFTGYTNSDKDISSTGVWDSTLNGTFDAYLAKFSSSGTRFWSTYYGGSQIDYGGALATDLSGNVYLGGSTTSPTDIATPGTWDVTYGGGQDLFLVKFNSSGIRLWGTYCGGSGIEQSFIALAVDPSGNVYLSGCTSSTTDIASSGAWDDTYGGNDDVFIVKFNSSGSRQWGTYFGGQNQEWIYYHSLTVDETGDVILGGFTTSLTDIASSGAWDESKNIGADAFLVKFSATGSRLWGTYYGGNMNEHIRGLQTDFTGNIYIIGYTESSSDISSNGAWDEVYGGNGDGFLAKFSSSGSRIWGTYYGGSDLDMGIALAINNSENLCIVGLTSSNTSISSIGAWDETFGGNRDGFIIKFGPDNQITTPTLSSNTYCQNQEFSLPYTVTGTYNSPNTFTTELSNANGSFANPTSLGTVSAVVSGTIACRIPIGTPAGTGYRIRITSSNPSVTSSDNGSNISINPMPIPVITGDKNSCVSTQSVSYSVPQIPGHTYLWQSVSKGEIIGSTTGNSVSVRWNATGTDTIKVRQTITASGCFKDTIFVVNIQGTPTPQITGSSSVCESNSVLQSYSISQVSGDAYLWFPPIKGEIIGNASGNSVQIKWTSSGTDTLRVRQTNGMTGCFKDTLLIVSINPVPSPLITGEKVVCAKISQYQYTVPLIAGNSYEWTIPAKGSIKGSRTNNAVTVTWNTSGSDTLKIRQTNTTTGCFKDTSIIVSVSELPAPTITGEQNICLSSSPSTFTVNQIPGFSIEWEKPRLGSIVSYKLNAVSIIWNASGTDSVRVKIKDNVSGCERDTILRVVIVKSPEPLITGDARACENQSPKVYRVQKQSGRTYTWNKPKNGIIIGSTTSDSISVQWVNFGIDTLRMEERDNVTNCAKDTSFIVSIAQLPDATIIGSNQVRENEQGIIYSVKNESGLSYEWSIVSGDATIAGKTGNSVTLNAGKPGTVILKAKITNQNGCMSESELSITVKSLTSIKESSLAPFTLYPNPAGDHLYVKMDADITGDIHIELYDVLGSRHFQQTYQSTEIIRIPVQSLTQGMYLIKVKTSQDEFMERFVK